MNQLFLFPCGGNAREALDAAVDFEVLGFIDDDIKRHGSQLLGHTVHGREVLRERSGSQLLAVPGNPDNFRDRARIIDSLGLPLERFATVVHPGAHVSARANIGKNVLIMAGVVIGPQVVIGNHVCILPNSVIHHDTVIGDFGLIGANVTIAGNVQIGKNAYIGSGASILQATVIGDGALVGLGSTVIRSVAAGAKVAGNPARVLGAGHG